MRRFIVLISLQLSSICFADHSYFALPNDAKIDTGFGQIDARDLEETDQILVKDDAGDEHYVFADTLRKDENSVAFALAQRFQVRLDGQWVSFDTVDSIPETNNEDPIKYKVIRVRSSVTAKWIPIVVAAALIHAADGGPALAVICGVVCEIVADIGCGAMALGWTAVTNPMIGIVYAAVCNVLAKGSTSTCMVTCAGFPTP